MKKAFFLIALLFATVLLYSENKTALIIGNGNYRNFQSLSHPVPEARQMEAALKRMGFSVTLLINADREQMLDALGDFEAILRKRGGIALFHYGGHAVQVEGKNYLVPTDADIPDARRVATRSVDVDEVMAALEMSGSDTNIVILDACRNNPLPGSDRSGVRGLAVAGRKPRNSIIVYSAESGTVAQDGVFTPTLLQHLETPGLDFTDILRNVRKAVYEKTGGKQIPGEYNQLFDPVYLAGKPSGGTESSGNSSSSGTPRKEQPATPTVLYW